MMATSEQELLGTDLGKYFSEIADKRGKNSEGRNRMHALPSLTVDSSFIH